MSIQLLFCGGTISSEQKEGVFLVSSKPMVLDYLQATYPNKQFLPKLLLNKHSENYLLEDIERIIRALREESKARANIVFCGTDALAYLAAFLYYGLDSSCKPTVLVSANAPIDDNSSNAKTNIAAAIAACEAFNKGVFVAYKNYNEPAKIYLGNSILSIPCFSNSVSAYPNAYAVLKGEKLEIVNPDLPVCGTVTYNFTKLTPSVVSIVSATGLDFRYYLSMKPLPKAFIVEAYHSSTACTQEGASYMASINSFAKECAKLGVDIYLSGFENREAYYQSSMQLGSIIKKMPLSTPALFAMLTLQYSSQ